MAKRFVTDYRGDVFTSNANVAIKDEPVTPVQENFNGYNYLDNSFENGFRLVRKSLSMHDVASLQEDVAKLQVDSTNDDMNVRYRGPNEGSQESRRTKFVTMAEAIYHYERDTPHRFHSSSSTIFRPLSVMGRPALTVPQSPMLRSKTRARTIHILSQQEKEMLEFEEAKKFKIRAKPVPKSVIEGSKIPEVPRRPATVPEPFHLTELHKNVIESPEKNVFKARPAPKHILEKPQIPVKFPAPVTERVSKLNEMQFKDVKSPSKVQRHGPLKPIPFSFEKRDEEMKRRKEQWIKEQIEEERRQASMFKAHPLPNAVRKQMQHSTAKLGSSTASSENKENNFKFEAKPPVVLYKEQFKPVLKQHLLIPSPFELNTEKRAAEREKFDNRLKENQAQLEREMQEKENRLKEEREREIAQLRAKLIHHPKPAPVVSPFVPEKSSAPLTVPETPKFVRRLKQQ